MTASIPTNPRATKPRQVTLTPPEGVPIPFDIAGLGARLYAQVVDLLLTQILLGLVMVALVVVFGFGMYLWVVWSLGYFFLRVPYYVLAEIAWNGATLGKRLTGLRVVDAGGGPLTIHAITVRNLLKEAEVFFPGALALGLGDLDGWVRWAAAGWVALTIAIPLLNTRRQRLGDMIAGTMVILRPQAVLLRDAAVDHPVAPAARAEAFAFSTAQLDHYGAYELQTLEGLVRQTDDHLAHRKTLSKQVLAEIDAVSAAIRTKIGYTAQVSPGDHSRFLGDFYRAQRRYLEEKQLLGDARADKFHASDKTKSP